MDNTNETLMQYFEWYIKPEENLWNKLAMEAPKLAEIGINEVWLPPAYKAENGENDTGYGVYDLYDLGEFDQKGSIRTKYGTKEEYLNAINVLHQNGIKVLADIVLNHKLGADDTEEVIAVENSAEDRNQITAEPHTIKAWTVFNFPGRNNKYSDFKWNWTCFKGVDWDEITKKSSVYKFYGKSWDNDVDHERGNFDYLMGADVDFDNVKVVRELTSWGKWYFSLTGVDGFRIDAAKHISAAFYKEWFKELRQASGKELSSIGEYWSTNVDLLLNYLNLTQNTMKLFDVPLHYNFYKAANDLSNFDMSKIFENTLVSKMPKQAITFVDNHDTEVGQALDSWVPEWFKPIAYSLILLRKQGVPCIFYGDYYGVQEKALPAINNLLDKLMYCRKNLLYGKQTDYFDNFNIIGWTVSGDEEHLNSGFAVILTDGPGGNKIMNVGKNLANSVLYDITGNISEPVYIDSEGNGIFYVNGGSVSIWVKK